MLSGQGLVNSITGSSGPPLSAYRILSPSIVRNCASIDAVGDEFITLPSKTLSSRFPPRQCDKDCADDASVHGVRGQILAECPRVVLPDRLVHLRQRKHDISGEPHHRTQ